MDVSTTKDDTLDIIIQSVENLEVHNNPATKHQLQLDQQFFLISIEKKSCASFLAPNKGL
jgi:hypothetical protein